MTKQFKLPTIQEIKSLLISLKQNIDNDFRASDDPDDNVPGMQVTVGADETGDWSYQTGDNSYSGGAYHYPFWGVISLYRRSNCRDLAKDIIDQISEYQWQ